MLRSIRYFNSAKLILGFGLLICALACGAYGVLLLPAVMGLEFDPLCPIIIGAFAAVFVLIALIMALFGAVHKSREKRSYEAMSENVECAVEEEDPEQTAPKEEPSEVSMVIAPHDGEKKEKLSLKADKESLKKVGLVAIPVAAACVLAVSLAAKNAKNDKAKNRKKLYRWLG